jgi:hypothetical protein
MPEPTLGIAPAGTPRDARHNERRRLALRRRSNLDERVVQRIEPVDAVRELLHAACGHIELEWELPAGGSRRAKVVASPVLALGHPHDARREVE